MKLLRYAVALAVLSHAAAALAKSQEYKNVSFDQFFAGSVTSIPLSLEIPVQYVYADAVSNRVTTYSYWMPSAEITRAAKTKDLPAKTGYVYGKLSQNEAYDRASDKFMSEDQAESQLAAAGMEVIERRRFQTKGYPIFTYIVRAKNGAVVCSMFVAMQIDTNVLYFSYRPPNNDLKVGRTVWNHILESIK